MKVTRPDIPYVCEFQAFNTLCSAQIFCRADAASIGSALQAECIRYEQLFSHTLPESELMRVNQACGAPVHVHPELACLLGQALRYCADTSGLFDISMGLPVLLWDAARAKNNGLASNIPSPEELLEACKHVDYGRVRVEKNTVQIEDPQAMLVLGGIAKGYVADALCKMLQDLGVKHGIVNLGGCVAVFGGKPTGMYGKDVPSTTPFVVGLHVPKSYRLGEDDIFGTVEISHGAVVTSGIYERGVRTQEGVFYHHILDPRTGMPAETDLVSVSLVSDLAIDGDGCTTALIIMGLSRAMNFVENLPGCEGVFVAKDGKVYTTSGIGNKVSVSLF